MGMQMTQPSVSGAIISHHVNGPPEFHSPPLQGVFNASQGGSFNVLPPLDLSVRLVYASFRSTLKVFH